MKVGFVFDDSLDRNDGVQQYVKTLSEWLMEAGHEVRFLVGETHAAGKLQPYVYSLSRNWQVRFNKNRLSIPHPAKGSKIKNVLNKEKFDVLHVQAPFSPMLASKVIRNVPDYTGVVATFHIVGSGWREDMGLRLLQFIEIKAINKIDVFLAVSSAAKKAAKAYFPDNPIISPNVVNFSKFVYQPKKIDTKVTKTIVFLGRLVERKGVRHLIEALRLLKSRPFFNDIQVVVAGTGPDHRKLVELTLEHKLDKNVRFLGFIEEDDKAGLLKSADLAVFPSISGESFGIVLIETMAVGTVTLGGENEGYRTVLNGPKEMLINPTDHRAFADRLELLLYNQDLQFSLRKWQYQRVRDFDVRKVGPDLLKHYRAAQQHSISLSKTR